MIDWYVLLFIAFTLIILLIDKVGRYRSVHEFTNPEKEVGLAGGTYSLVIQYMTGATVLFPLILTAKGGLSSFFIFTGSSLILYLLVRKWVFSPDKMEVILHDPFHSPGKINAATFLIFGFSSMGNILIQTSLMIILFRDFFHQPSYLGVFLFLIFSYVLFGLGGKMGITRVGSLILIGVLFTMSFTVLTLYLRTGTEVVYQRFMTHFQGIFSGSILENGSYFLTFLFVMAGQTFTSVYFWESIKTIKPHHRLSALRYSSFSWTALLLSYTALTVYLLSQTKTSTSVQLLESMIQSNTIITPIFIYTGISMLAVGTGHSLYSIVSLFLQHTQASSYRKLKTGYLFGVLMIVLLGLAGVLLAGSFETWLPYFMSFFASASIPFFYIVMKGPFSLKHFSLTVGLMSVAGIVINLTVTEVYMVVPVTVALTFVLHTLVTKFK
ncbi:hypothetical protein [Rossellomorea sp. KS-H15a]|uniref:hypothetical protein n=1 Tax=Rossellomorea sp. KS-H15a TaxID=2963940 RepID=UPI0020C653C5|nr:hypothetical protein [Rossellomorea sp. KS-H15a]UTE77469.1 hypothetical protein M1J35_01230 [Rossellomorea sp. KS-H15a]